ncbi:MAG: hypothetical protein WCE68_11145 [Anaerolineales bacterium]
MKTTSEPLPDLSGWALLVGPKSLNASMLDLIAKLDQDGPVLVLDCGGRFDLQASAQPGQAHQTILVGPRNCGEVLAFLEAHTVLTIPLVILDMLRPFYDESIPAEQRKATLEACLRHLKRLEAEGWISVSIYPPATPSPCALQLMVMAAEAAAVTILTFVEGVASLN